MPMPPMPEIATFYGCRKAEQVGLYDNVTDLHASPYIWAFQRGPFVVVLTKIGGEIRWACAAEHRAARLDTTRDWTAHGCRRWQQHPTANGLRMAAGNGSIINPAPITLEGIQEEGLRGTRVLQNVLNNSESLTVSAGGVATIAVSLSGYPQIFYAGEALPFSSFTGQNPAVSGVCTGGYGLRSMQSMQSRHCTGMTGGPGAACCHAASQLQAKP
jgi:hypothetical protein